METPPQRFVAHNQENDRSYPDLSFDQVLADLGQQNALLWTDLPRGLPRLRGHCRVYIRLVAGQIAGGWVERQGKRVDVSLDINSLHTVKSWTARALREESEMNQGATPQTSPPPAQFSSHNDALPRAREQPQTPPRSLDERIPRKREQVQLQEESIQHWPARERMCLRMVLLMVDGRRSIKSIKEQIQLPPEMIEHYLTVLSSMSVVEI